MSSDFTIEVDGWPVPVAVQRHPRARQMRLRFDPLAQCVRLVIPAHAPIGPAKRWTQEQADWISRQLADQPCRQRVGDGTMLPWRGGDLHIMWQADRPRMPQLAVDSGTALLLVGGPECHVGARVARWLQQQARTEFARMTDEYAARAGLSHRGVSVGDPRARWGSCSASGRIRYSWRIAMAPDFVRRSLVAHEVAHLAHMNHGPLFHRLFDELAGPLLAEQSRRWLKVNGRMLQLFDFGTRN